MNILSLVFVFAQQVGTLRMVHEKLLRLLPGGKQQALTSNRVFEPFSGLNPLHYNPYTEVSCREFLVHVYSMCVCETSKLPVHLVLDPVCKRLSCTCRNKKQ